MPDGGYVQVQNLAALQRWAEHAEDLLDKMDRADMNRVAQARERRERGMRAWISEHASASLQAALAECDGQQLGAIRGDYVRERAAREMYGWTPVPFSAFGRNDALGKLTRRTTALDYAQVREALGALPKAEQDTANPDYPLVEVRVVSGERLRSQLVFLLPPALRIDLGDDVALITGMYSGYALIRSFELRTTKTRMWQVLAEGVERRGPGAVDYLAPCLEDERWKVWLQTLPAADKERPGRRLKTWICDRQWVNDQGTKAVVIGGPSPEGLWTAREKALAEMLDLADDDPEAIRRMSELSSPLAA
jgi:hypothetical protein